MSVKSVFPKCHAAPHTSRIVQNGEIHWLLGGGDRISFRSEVKQMMAIVGHVGSVQIVVRSEVHGVRGAN